MKFLGNQQTKLELTLFAWTALNVGVGVWVLFNAPLDIYGSRLAAFLPLAIGIPAAGFLLWRLLKPTRVVLAFGALFWALQIVTVRLPEALYKFRLGLSIDYRLTDDPNYVISINLLAVIVTALFITATVRHSEEELLVATQ